MAEEIVGMKPYYQDDAVTLYHGDNIDIMAQLEPESFVSIVTDPPYGLAFMGKRWDYEVPSVATWQAAQAIRRQAGHRQRWRWKNGIRGTRPGNSGIFNTTIKGLFRCQWTEPNIQTIGTKLQFRLKIKQAGSANNADYSVGFPASNSTRISGR
jgi:DNA modification methylase